MVFFFLHVGVTNRSVITLTGIPLSFLSPFCVCGSQAVLCVCLSGDKSLAEERAIRIIGRVSNLR
jgi:hypothetical protein